MAKSVEILKLRVLLCFLQEGDNVSVTGIAKTLGEDHYTISRIIKQFENEGLVCRTEPRRPQLTECGRAEAENLAERIHIAQNHLLYEGVSAESAKTDSLYWALYNSDDTMRVIRSTDEFFRVKYELRGKSEFSGALVCKTFSEGTYHIPFIIYREHLKDGENISMSNAAFEHPCLLVIRKDVSIVQLRALPVTARSHSTGQRMSGKVLSVKYFYGGEYISAECSGDLLSFPAGAMKFRTIGSYGREVLHGSVSLKMQCTVGSEHMPESSAIFTMIF